MVQINILYVIYELLINLMLGILFITLYYFMISGMIISKISILISYNNV